MSLFKQATARGVAHELMRLGYAPFLSKEAADEAADLIAETGVPDDLSGPSGHDPQVYVQLAEQLIHLAEALLAEAPGQKVAAVMTRKTAASMDLESAAYEAAVSVMEKQAGALIEGGDKGNDLPGAATVQETAKLDQKQRPEGSYAVPQGDTSLDTMEGEVGKLKEPDVTPGASDVGSNSLETDKTAKMKEILAKQAAALIQGGDKGNSLPQAAAVQETAKLDQKDRPEGKYKVPAGGANFSEPQAARVGTEESVPPSQTVSGTNSVIEASKTAEDEAFMLLFKKCAADVGPYLPPKLSDEEKVAAVKSMIGLDHDGRQSYLNSVYEKVAAEEKNKEEEEEEEEGEKSASSNQLLDEIRKAAKGA